MGDAAGLAYPESGEGIRPAVESGLLAADTIVAARGEYSFENLERYRECLEDPVRTPRLDGHRLDAAALGGTDVDGEPAARHAVVRRRFVIERWFLHAHDRT